MLEPAETLQQQMRYRQSRSYKAINHHRNASKVMRVTVPTQNYRLCVTEQLILNICDTCNLIISTLWFAWIGHVLKWNDAPIKQRSCHFVLRKCTLIGGYILYKTQHWFPLKCDYYSTHFSILACRMELGHSLHLCICIIHGYQFNNNAQLRTYTVITVPSVATSQLVALIQSLGNQRSHSSVTWCNAVWNVLVTGASYWYLQINMMSSSCQQLISCNLIWCWMQTNETEIHEMSSQLTGNRTFNWAN